MIAYFVHDKKEHADTIVLPDLGCSVAVDETRLTDFISVNPTFKEWTGDACGLLTPEDYGTIVATRDDCGDVNVIKETLWHERLAYHFGSGR
jgi:hypothetical protein